MNYYDMKACAHYSNGDTETFYNEIELSEKDVLVLQDCLTEEGTVDLELLKEKVGLQAEEDEELYDEDDNLYQRVYYPFYRDARSYGRSKHNRSVDDSIYEEELTGCYGSVEDWEVESLEIQFDE